MRLCLIPALIFLAFIQAAGAQTLDYASDIRPIFESRCYSCHGPQKQKNGLRLDRKAAAMTGGDSGKVIVPGRSADSPLIQRVTSAEKTERMPSNGEPLTPTQIAFLKSWIDQGAVWPDDGAKATDKLDWWAYKPIVRPTIPQFRNPQSAIRNPIDSFIAAKLEEKGLSPSPEADRRTLIRRLSFDLIGLPPSPEDVDAFVFDPDPLAYEKLVDRLLGSPAYGERWARHWLDVVHYGDTHGYDKDKPRPNAWPYRDYVIRSLNEDKPYGRFVQEQIAGDVLFPESPAAIIATGFIAAGPWDFIGHAEVPESKIDGKIARLLDRDDMVSNTFNTFLSTTIQCARCHNHKFDPIVQEDYYRLQAVFAALDRADRSFDADPNVAKRRAELETHKRDLLTKKQRIDETSARQAGPELAEIDRVTRDELAAIAKSLDDNSRETAKLPPPQIVYAGTVHYGTGAFSGTGAAGGRPRTIHVLKRGDVRAPDKEVGPGTVPLLPGDEGLFKLSPNHSEGDRRAALARWIIDARHPLTWRSVVNRVWQYHFGRGIVDSPNDFGHMGRLPAHPELLDWLANEFRDGPQSLKQLHRIIVTSATYRQSSANRDAFAKIDSGNVYLWRMNRRKLEAEAVRDAALVAAGKWNSRMGGPGFQDFVIEKPEHSPHYQYHLYDPENPNTHRRSVYRFVVRSQPQPFMTTLDCADPSMSVDKRNETLTALQALALMNNRFILTMAKHMAERVEGLAATPDERITLAFRAALGRSPTEPEQAALVAYARIHGMANACRVILNLNEFVFVD